MPHGGASCSWGRAGYPVNMNIHYLSFFVNRSFSRWIQSGSYPGTQQPQRAQISALGLSLVQRGLISVLQLQIGTSYMSITSY